MRLQTVTDRTGSPAYSATYTYLDNSPLVRQILFKQGTTTRMTTTKQHDYLNRLTSISSSIGSSAIGYSYAYNNANQRVRSRLADGSYWLYDYDSLGQVRSGHKFWPDQTPVAGQQFEYTHDDIGNRKQTKAGGDQNGGNLRIANYWANNLNQYTNRDVPGYADVMGLSFATNTVTVGGQTAYRKGEYFRDQLPVSNGSSAVWTNIVVSATGQTSVGGNAFVPQNQEHFYHDLDGNLTGDGRWTYGWDAENRLVSLTPSTGVGPQISLRFDYDWQGRRIHKQVWDNTTWNGALTNNVSFVYDGWNLLAELNWTNNAVIRSFMWGLDLSGSSQGAGGIGGLLKTSYTSAQTTNCFVAFDGNGNVAGLVDASGGGVLAQYEFGPFGELLRATGPMAKANPFRFSTKYQDDETDLLYYGYRYYNPSTGRWLGRDPGAYSEASNLYGFNGDDPIDYTDFLGLYVVYSEGYAFRDPWYGSLGAQSGSGFSRSTAASYSGWGSPWRTAICNSGVLNEGPDGDYPPERTSFVKASVWYFDRCTKRYRITCKATLKGRVWGRLNQGPPKYVANGTVLQETVLPSETTTTPAGPDGSTFTIQFQKTVTKDITLTQDSKRPYILYHLYMPIALQVKNHFRGGFLESGEASCTISSL